MSIIEPVLLAYETLPPDLLTLNQEPVQGQEWYSDVGLHLKGPATQEANLRTFIISTTDLDRDGDVLESKGVILKNYKKNPRVMWGHDYRGIPIGRSPRIEVRDKEIEADVLFAPTAFAQEVKMLVDLDFLGSASVGFIPWEWKIREPKPFFSTEDMPDEGITRRIVKGFHFTKWELLEWSIVSIPANPNALVVGAKAKGLALPLLEDLLKQEVVTKPGIDETESEFRVRLRNPDDFQPGSFRTMPLKRDKPRIFAIVGRLRGETKATMQALRFPKGDGWTKEKVRSWLDAHPDIGKAMSAVDKAEIYGGSFSVPMASLETLKEMQPVVNERGTVEMTQELFTMIRDRIVEEETKAGVLDNRIVALDAQIEHLQKDNMDLQEYKALFEEMAEDASALEKVGAVLNRKNKERLQQAVALVQEVLKSAEQPNEEDMTSVDGDGKAPETPRIRVTMQPAAPAAKPPVKLQGVSPETLAAALSVALDKVLAKLQGRVT